MGAVVARGAPAGILILAIRRSAKKQAERSAQPVETKDETKRPASTGASARFQLTRCRVSVCDDNRGTAGDLDQM